MAMKKIYRCAQEMIGNTPLLEVCGIEKEKNLCARLLIKLEGCNPGGSAKDRVGLAMIDDAEERGLIGPGSVIIEPTSGNTGIGLACVAAARGYRVVIVMPDSMSIERRQLLAAYGAELVLTDGKLGMKGAIERAQELAAKTPGSFIPGQFENPANAMAHYRTTGPEIFEDTQGEVDIFVAGIGTGGTITGTGRFLKEMKPEIQVVGVEPASSPLLSCGRSGAHGLQGIGANFVPDILDMRMVDQVMTVTEEEAYAAGRMIGRLEGVLVGISSGACLHAAMALAAREENRGKTIVALMPDAGDRYLSTPMFAV